MRKFCSRATTLASRNFTSAVSTQLSFRAAPTVSYYFPARFFSDTPSQGQPQEGGNTTATAENKESSGPKLSDEQISELLAKSKKMEQEIKELKDTVLRSYAEEENVRRIAKKDVESARLYAISGFAKSLLDVADNFERALDSTAASKQSASYNPEDVLSTLVTGVQMTHTQLQKAFTANGVVKFGQIGDSFDPALHDALFNITDPTKTSGTIGQVLKAGYKLKDRVIRAAEVGTIN
jgi:molecular chaperone GrpE